MGVEGGHVIDGRFRVERKLGAGGMGVVYLARQVNVDREVAIKLLRPERADDDRAIDQFLNETAAVSRLTSPHTVTLYDAGRTADGDPYIAMEYLPGPTLRQRMAEPMETDEVVRILDGISLSLAEAHERGIVHRDLKPSNVLLARTPGHRAQVKVLDFGLARLVDTDERETKAAGTLRYMAPEALRGGRVDARADVYALAMVAYEMFAGHYPFDDTDRERLVDDVLTRVPPPLDEVVDPPLPSRATKLIARGLGKHPRLRPRDAATFRRQLRRAFELPDEPSEEASDPEGAVGLETHPSQTVVSKTLPGTVAGETTLFIPMQSRRRMGGAVAAVAVVAGLTVFALRNTSSSSSSVPTPPLEAREARADTVTLGVQSVPAGATVTLDGETRGVTPLDLEVPRGVACDIVLEAEGYEPHRQHLDATRGVDLVIRLTPHLVAPQAVAPELDPPTPEARPVMKAREARRTPTPSPSPAPVASTPPAAPEPAAPPAPAAKPPPDPSPAAQPPAAQPPAAQGNDFEQRVNDYMN